MRRNTGIFYMSVLFCLASVNLFAQGNVDGRIIDKVTKQGIPGVSIYNQKTLGTTTNETGEFSLSLSEGKHILNISSIGYVSLNIDITIDKEKTLNLGTIELSPYIIGLEQVNIISSIAVNRETPVAVSTIPAKMIKDELGDQPLPEVMKMVPGVYPTRTGGGSGDARVNIRGFKQENIALLLNGIPIGSVENGLVYWNNWLGLADATQSIQVQRGLGASKVALNSVGGTINIITKTTEAKKGGTVGFSITDYGNSKFTFSYSTGKLKNGLNITFLGSLFRGPGYVDATYVKGWGYFLSVSKDFGSKHKLVFVGLGNPEKHGQRNSMLSQQEIDQYGLKFNKDWGSYNGKTNNASENFYHKPHFSLNHYWNISEKSFLATSLYLSFGYGGGKWSDSYMTNKRIFDYRNPSQQIDWPAIYNDNVNNTDTAILANGDSVTGFSKNVQTNFLASHVWTGIISTFEHDINDNFSFMVGIHARYFKSKLQQKVRDLLGGQFFIDNYAWAIDGVAGRNEIKKVGDIIKVNNGAIINFGNIFAQMEFTNGAISAFIAGTFNNTWFQRVDYYNYVSDTKSEVVSMAGFDFKGGANYNINEFHNVYFNAGYYSRVPYYKFVFGKYTNEPSRDLENEQISAFELGYGLTHMSTNININVYHTYWQDKSFLANEYNQFLDPVLVKGLDALHKGIELEARQKITKHLTIGGIASFGNWKWKNNVAAEIYNKDNVIVDTVNVYADGLYVGDAPQTQFGFFGQYRFLDAFELTVNWVQYEKIFADFNPVMRNNPSDNSQSYQIPSYNILDIHFGFNFKMFGYPAYANLSCFNVLNKEYITRGLDGPSHDIDNFTGFWGFGRTFYFGLKINF